MMLKSAPVRATAFDEADEAHQHEAQPAGEQADLRGERRQRGRGLARRRPRCRVSGMRSQASAEATHAGAA